MSRATIEIREIHRGHETALNRFFESIVTNRLERFFSPHPFTLSLARERVSYIGQDFYCLLLEDDRALAYGMLRGWDEGYSVPSLGLIVHPEEQRRGLGRLMMNFLRFVATRRGASRIRLRVHRENSAAIRLYESLGYLLGDDREASYLLGFLELGTNSAEGGR
jgi:ribosomal protein S18 acetylase RimI-like enzyme